MKYTPHISGAFVAFTIIYLASLVQQDHPVASYSREYQPLTVVPGQLVSAKADVERTATCTSDVLVQWIDQTGNLLKEERYEGGLLKTGNEQFQRNRFVPSNAPEGILRLRVKTTFYCNWLQRLIHVGSDFIMPDVIFTVKEKQ